MSKTKKKNSTKAKGSASKPKPKKNPAPFVMKPTVVQKKKKKKSNPELLGVRMSTSDFAMVLLAGLGGVTVTKLIPPQMPAQLTETNIGRVMVSGAVALGAAMLAANVNPRLGLAVGFGGGMQTMSVALNAFLPTVGAQIGLSGDGRRPGMGTLLDVPFIPGVSNPFAPQLGIGPASMTPAPAVMGSFVDGDVSAAYPAAY